MASLAILVAVGIREDGQKVLLGLRSKGSESREAWKGMFADLVHRGLRRPFLVILDGCPGLRAAVQELWAGIEVQRCAVHKLRNLLSHALKHAYDEVRDDFHAIVYAESEAKGREAYEKFLAEGSKRTLSVAKSLEKGGEELLTF